MKTIFSKSRILFNEMMDDAKIFFTREYSQSNSVFTPSSPFGQLLQAIISFAQRAFFYIEDSITELNINTASRPSSIRAISTLVGHNPNRANAATGILSIEYNGNPIDINGTQIIIPSGTKIKCLNNNLYYSILSSKGDIRISITNRNKTNIKVVQGYFESQSFTGNGQNLQSFNVYVKNGIFIDQNNIKVYVNGEEYKIYDSFYDIPNNYSGCLVSTSINNGIDVKFGNGYQGKIPPLGSIIDVEYLITGGSIGNILEISDNVKFKFDDPLYDTIGNEISVGNQINIKMESGIVLGSAPENIELTRILAPKTSRNFVLATPDNYITFLQKLNYFSIIDCFTTFDDNYLEDDNVIYIFLVPDINKRLRTSENYFNIDQNKFLLNNNETDAVYNYITESGSMLVTTELRIIRPIIKKYIILISIIIWDYANPDFIKQEIIEKLNIYLLSFIRRDRLPKSDIIAILESIDGIDSVNIEFVSEDNELKAKKYIESNSTEEYTNIGIDENNDIVIGNGELLLIRGGWEDRNGVYYNDGVNFNNTSSINIEIKEIKSASTYNKQGIKKMKSLK